MNAVECPQAAELSEFLLGHLSRRASARIAEHERRRGPERGENRVTLPR